MKLAAISTILAATAQATAWQEMGIFIEKNFDWSNFDQEIENAVNNGYNKIYVGFYMARYGCTAACTAWRDLQPSVQQNALDFLNKNNAQLVLSVCGPGEFVEGDIRDGLTDSFATQSAQFAKDQGFHGIDYSCSLGGSKTEPSLMASNGTYMDFMQTMIAGGKSAGYTADKISVTAQAPYFSPDFVNSSMPEYSLSYLALDANKNEQFYVGKINMNMLNEGINYLSYNDIFVQNTASNAELGQWAKGSSVKEVASLGIDLGAISIVKSVSSAESSVQTGYVSPSTLGQWGCQANAEFGWNGGYLGWTWNIYDSYNTLNWPSLLGDCN